MCAGCILYLCYVYVLLSSCYAYCICFFFWEVPIVLRFGIAWHETAGSGMKLLGYCTEVLCVLCNIPVVSCNIPVVSCNIPAVSCHSVYGGGSLCFWNFFRPCGTYRFMLGGRNAEDYDGVQISVRWDMCVTECIVCLPGPWPLHLSFSFFLIGWKFYCLNRQSCPNLRNRPADVLFLPPPPPAPTYTHTHSQCPYWSSRVVGSCCLGAHAFDFKGEPTLFRGWL